MNLNEFNKAFSPFYAEFGYCASGSLPELAQNAVVRNLVRFPDTAIEIVLEHSTVERYFVRLFWRTANVGEFNCTLEQYDLDVVPSSVIVASLDHQKFLQERSL